MSQKVFFENFFFPASLCGGPCFLGFLSPSAFPNAAETYGWREFLTAPFGRNVLSSRSRGFSALCFSKAVLGCAPICSDGSRPQSSLSLCSGLQSRHYSWGLMSTTKNSSLYTSVSKTKFLTSPISLVRWRNMLYNATMASSTSLSSPTHALSTKCVYTRQ